MQVLRFLRPEVLRKDGTKVVAIRLVDANKICKHSTVLEEAVKNVGETNIPLDFLKDDSRDAVLKNVWKKTLLTPSPLHIEFLYKILVQLLIDIFSSDKNGYRGLLYRNPRRNQTSRSI